jgi:hypothetical protein
MKIVQFLLDYIEYIIGIRIKNPTPSFCERYQSDLIEFQKN